VAFFIVKNPRGNVRGNNGGLVGPAAFTWPFLIARLGLVHNLGSLLTDDAGGGKDTDGNPKGYGTATSQPKQ
jgi:hypothetical protein